MSAATLSPVASVDLQAVMERLFDSEALIAAIDGRVRCLALVEQSLPEETSIELTRALTILRELVQLAVFDLDRMVEHVQQAEGKPAASPAIKPTSER